MDFGRYQIEDEIIAFDNTYATRQTLALTETSEGTYALVYDNGFLVIETFAPGGSSALNSFYMVEADGVGAISPDPDAEDYERYTVGIKAQLSQERLIVVFFDATGVAFNVLTNNLTLDRTFGGASYPEIFSGTLDVDPAGNFAYFGASDTTVHPKLYYFAPSASSANWNQTPVIDAGWTNYQSHEVKFLSNGNLVTVSNTIGLEGESNIGWTVWSNTGTALAFAKVPVNDPIDMPRTVSVSAYEGYFVIFFMANQSDRYAVRYQNDGTLVTQSSYLVQPDHGHFYLGVQSEFLASREGPILSVYEDYQGELENNRTDFRLVLHNPNQLDSQGRMLEEEYRFRDNSVELDTPRIAPLQNGGFVLAYMHDGGASVRFTKFTLKNLRNSRWGWWWNSRVPRKHGRAIRPVYHDPRTD